MRFDREQLRMVFALFVVAAIAAILLGLTDMLTREPIAEAQKQALHRALEQVLPAHGNDPQAQVVNVAGTAIYPARVHGALAALAWEVIAPDGYSGRIRILVGVHPDGHVLAIRITDHKETPGLGDGIVGNQPWLDSFRDRSLDNVRWQVKKDGGDFDQFTGATITPRAVVRAVKAALLFYRHNRAAIVARLNGEAKAPQAAGSNGSEGGDE
ncbi:MAG: NADH:ubiquinone oxidoreductase subunit RnfG [Zetaproteobacteria bacterium CG23_combo_of_CG06-09_8_20_14_all_54_7]|nr:MAG: NADH:ubiquinone oxidoreductase subunit RnfG [Zetaproteobacteria bacterium CG23_combo_of_CG06-09_8_20_14_all_54_7]